MGRPRVPGGTTSRGYGIGHQQLRRSLLAAFIPGTICWRCQLPMWPHQILHLDHNDDRTGYNGLVHAACNTGRRTPGPPRPSPGRRW
jgi:hypothetical protein